MRHPQLRELVIEQLKAFGPSGRLLTDGLSAVRVCTEAIYRFSYGKEDYALELYRHLPEDRRNRRPDRSLWISCPTRRNRRRQSSLSLLKP
ncbi:IS30 family transposase [Ensifer sp. 4252]